MTPSHRLDLVLVPTDLDAPIARALRLLDRLREERVIDDRGLPGSAASAWGASFARIVVEDPRRIVLWANRQGGFRVDCPTARTPITAAFSSALTAWREGGGAPLPSAVSFGCPACGRQHALTDASARPPFAFGPWALVTVDTGELDLSPPARAWVAAEIGPVSTILRRG